MTAETLRDPVDAVGGYRSQQARIRQAAVLLFTRQSYAGTTMKQLARELNMTPANLYNYFPSKDAILFDVLRHELTGMLERDHRIVGEVEEPVARMRALAYDLVLDDLRSPTASFVGRHGVHGLTDEARDEIADLMGQVRGIWSTTIGQGAAAGAFAVDDVRLSTLTVLSLCSSTTTWYRPGGGLTPEQIADHTADAVLRMLGAAPAAG